MTNFEKVFTESESIKRQIPFQDRIDYFLKQVVLKPRWILVFLLARFTLVRLIHQQIYQVFFSASNPITRKASLFPELDSHKAINSLNKDGIFDCISLPESIVKEILDFVYASKCYGGGKPHFGFKIDAKRELDAAYDKPFFVAKYFNVSESCSAIRKLAQDPKIWQIATTYIGKKAKYTGASLYWTFPVEDSSYDSDQLGFCQYHYDLDDFASIRFSFYLTDVDLDAGPHICILGSHRLRAFFHEANYFSRRPAEQQLKNFYGENKIISLTGKAGSGFIEDTFCFHRGSVPKSTRRLFLQLHFAVNNYNPTEHHDYRAVEELRDFG